MFIFHTGSKLDSDDLAFAFEDLSQACAPVSQALESLPLALEALENMAAVRVKFCVKLPSGCSSDSFDTTTSYLTGRGAQL